MTTSQWMLYGAYGFTGKLIAEEAVRRGHRPLLAGRNLQKLRSLAERLNLEYMAFELNSPLKIEQELSKVRCVLHAAGPHTITAAPLRKACIKSGVNYLDITGEVNVFEESFAHDVLARQKSIAIVSGVGFDVVPTDCLILHAKQSLPDAIKLDVCLKSGAGNSGSLKASAGTMKSLLEILKNGGVARRDGKLVPYRLGHSRQVDFHGNTYSALAIPWGDLSTAVRTADIQHITTYIVLSPNLIRLVKLFGPIIRYPLMVTPLRRILQGIIDLLRKDKPADVGGTLGKNFVWVRVENALGQSFETRLETIEAYRLTAITAVDSIEKILKDSPIGALSPAQLLGADYLLTLEGTTRYDG